MRWAGQRERPFTVLLLAHPTPTTRRQVDFPELHRIALVATNRQPIDRQTCRLDHGLHRRRHLDPCRVAAHTPRTQIRKLVENPGDSKRPLHAPVSEGPDREVKTIHR